MPVTNTARQAGLQFDRVLGCVYLSQILVDLSSNGTLVDKDHLLGYADSTRSTLDVVLTSL